MKRRALRVRSCLTAKKRKTMMGEKRNEIHDESRVSTYDTESLCIRFIAGIFVPNLTGPCPGSYRGPIASVRPTPLLEPQGSGNYHLTFPPP
jgi:hypothetical protein